MSSGGKDEEPLTSETSEISESMEVTGAGEAEVKTTNNSALPIHVGQPKKSTVEPLPVFPELLSGQGEYTCKMCSETFISLAQLAKHMQFHDRDRPYPCTICGKRFLTRSHHDEHQRVHTGERPFLCDRCDRSFTTHHNLKRHQIIHDKEEAYRCTVCGVLFCQEHQLGNLSGIIRVLKQHDIMEPESFLELESKMMLEPEMHELEPQLRKQKKKLKHTHPGLDENCSDFTLQEKQPGTVPEIVPTANFSIRQIAYDIEVVL
ncbi:zinc finger protein 574-like [Trichomycterus rosablanca]|uniref:zinc finger protein 574-like n=1 Tax=Trichomycterus rosablanca TaxID=2290929 RepID=UPI002F354228